MDKNNNTIIKAKIEVSSLNERGDPIDFDNVIKTEFPSVYFTLRLLTDVVDPSRERYYPRGATNLKNGSGNVKVKLENKVNQDYAHSSHYAKMNNVQITHNAGDITHLWTTTDSETGIESLYGTARIGQEHKLFDENNKIVGEAYASAWLTHAQAKVNRQEEGSIQDYIPEKVWAKYFKDGQLVLPLKGLSVELAHLHYRTENMIDGNGVKHIFKYDLVAVSWLSIDREGQPYSRIEESTIKSIINMNKNTIKCLCEAKVGDNVIKEVKIYEVMLKNDVTHNYTIKDIVTDEEIVITSEVIAEEYKLLSDIMSDTDITELEKTVIKTCLSCQEKKLKIAELEKTAKTKSDLLATEKKAAEDLLINKDQAKSSDIQVIMDMLVDMQNQVTTIASRIEMIEKKALEVTAVEEAQVAVVKAQEVTAVPETESIKIENIIKTFRTNSNPNEIILKKVK